MTKIYTKIPAIIGMIVCVIGFVLIIISIAFTIYDGTVNLALLIGRIIVTTATISYLFYFIDAILSIVKAIIKIRPIFNSILALLIVGTIPMELWALRSKRIYIGLLCAYYLAIFVLEVISVVKHIKKE